MSGKIIKQSVIIDSSPEEVYSAWMDSEKHGDMIGADAKIDPKIGGKFSMWGGTVFGKTLELDPKKHRIVQEWISESDNWPNDKPSKLVIVFEEHENQTKVFLSQSDVPESEIADVEEGWKDFYWNSMKKYFSKSS